MRGMIAGVLTLICLSPVTGAETAGQLTLSESVKLALANNRQIQQSKQSVLGAAARVDEAKSYRYPQLNLSAGYTYLNNIPVFSVPGMGEFKLASPDNYSYKATVAQSLFDWGRINKGISLGRAELEATGQGVALAEREITYAVIGFFQQLLAMREAVRVIDDNIKLLEEQVAMMKKKYEAGEASDFDILSIQVQISAAQGQRLDAVNGLRKMELEFNLILGRPVNTPVILQGGLANKQPDINEDACISEALDNRIEIRQVQNKERMAQLQKDLAATGNKPSLNAFAGWELKNGYQPDLDELRGGWSFGAMLSFPVFEGWRTRAQVRQADAALSGIRLEYQEQSQSIEKEVRQAVLDVRSAWQRTEIGKLAAAQAGQAFRIAQERHNSGLIDTLDLLSAQQSLKSAQLNYLQSSYNYSISRYNLEKAVGREFTVDD